MAAKYLSHCVVLHGLLDLAPRQCPGGPAAARGGEREQRQEEEQGYRVIRQNRSLPGIRQMRLVFPAMM